MGLKWVPFEKATWGISMTSVEMAHTISKIIKVASFLPSTQGDLILIKKHSKGGTTA